MSTKEEFVRKMHSKLDLWSAEIDKLSAKADQAGAEARAEYHKHIDELRAKKAAAQHKLEEFKQTSEGAWEDVKTGVELAWDAMGEAVDSVKSRFK